MSSLLSLETLVTELAARTSCTRVRAAFCEPAFSRVRILGAVLGCVPGWRDARTWWENPGMEVIFVVTSPSRFGRPVAPVEGPGQCPGLQFRATPGADVLSGEHKAPARNHELKRKTNRLAH